MVDMKNIFVAPFQDVDMYALVGESLEDKDRQILVLNKKQLNTGKRSDGKSLGKYKNFKYKNRFEPVDLYKTGDFWNKFTLTAGKKSAEIFSQDKKSSMLEKKYGKEIFGLTKENTTVAEDIVKPGLQDLFKEAVMKNV